MTTEIFFMIVYFIIAMFFMVMYVRLKNRTSAILEKEYEIHMSVYEDNYDMRHFLETASGEDLLVYQYIYKEYINGL